MKWLLICFTLVECNPVFAQTRNCGKRETVILRLAEKYEEHQRGLGLAQNGKVIELYSAEAGNWTLLETLPDGRTCLLAAGEGWQTPINSEQKGDPA